MTDLNNYYTDDANHHADIEAARTAAMVADHFRNAATELENFVADALARHDAIEARHVAAVAKATKR